MVLTGCSQCIKYTLFLLNFIFWLAGGVILGIAVWLRADTQTSNLLMVQFEGSQAPGTFYISVYVLIAVGAVMMFVGFVGCYGAIQESQCLLGTFFTCLVILFACEVAAGIWGFINKDTISTELINFYDTAYMKAVDPVDSPTKQSASQVLQAFHDTLECCGKGDDNELFLAAQASLCPKKPVDLLVSQDCHLKLKDLFSERLHLIGMVALVIAAIMVFEMIFTMVLCCAIRAAVPA
ncbi:CD81 molecule b [Trichomycterus rosablanca]|uniref:CD81 molecule b n=1 Tax=Trichomycterus rosablanca TaxID=2290929 RepID=UPI002F35C529